MRLLLLGIIMTISGAFKVSFYEPLYSSYKLVEKLSKVGSIDESHNEVHSKEVLYWTTKIIDTLPFKLEQEELLLIGQCALLHDLVDSKYTDFSVEVTEHLTQYHSTDTVCNLLKILHTMSYSKIVSKNKISYPQWIESSDYVNVYHIVREADLLASYNIARMIKYRQNKGNFTKKQIINEVKEIYNNRMKTLVKRDLFYYKNTQDLAQALNTVALLKLELLDTVDFNSNMDILKIVNYLSIHDLINTYKNY